LRSAHTLERDAIVDVECDVWIPAARPDVLRRDNVARLKAKIVAQGANIPATPEAEKILFDRGVANIPDFIANAGGVICAAGEYAGATQKVVFEEIAEKIRANTREVLERAKEERRTERSVAVELATERVKQAMRYRRR
jgi:glutamate dehydrogenase (NAD(P)+)